MSGKALLGGHGGKDAHGKHESTGSTHVAGQVTYIYGAPVPVQVELVTEVDDLFALNPDRDGLPNFGAWVDSPTSVGSGSKHRLSPVTFAAYAGAVPSPTGSSASSHWGRRSGRPVVPSPTRALRREVERPAPIDEEEREPEWPDRALKATLSCASLPRPSHGLRRTDSGMLLHAMMKPTRHNRVPPSSRGR